MCCEHTRPFTAYVRADHLNINVPRAEERRDAGKRLGEFCTRARPAPRVDAFNCRARASSMPKLSHHVRSGCTSPWNSLRCSATVAAAAAVVPRSGALSAFAVRRRDGSAAAHAIDHEGVPLTHLLQLLHVCWDPKANAVLRAVREYKTKSPTHCKCSIGTECVPSKVHK